MANIATTGATFVCIHGGTISGLTAATSIMKVSGVDVIIASDVAGATIGPPGTACPWAGGSPCTTVGAVQSGVSTKTKKGGTFVLLSGATFLTNGTPGPYLLTVTETQTKLTST